MEEAVYHSVRCRHMLDEALERLEDSGADVFEYRDAAKKVRVELRSGSLPYETVDEVLAALILCHAGVMYDRPVRIGGHHVGFVLTGLKAVLEIDMGFPTGSRKDEAILEALGEGWEVVHLKGSQLEKYRDRIVETVERLHRKNASLRNSWDAGFVDARRPTPPDDPG